jgi:hypothetical protein
MFCLAGVVLYLATTELGPSSSAIIETFASLSIKKAPDGILSVSLRKFHKSPLTPVIFSIKKLQTEDDYD